MLSVFDGSPGHSRREFLRIGTLVLSGLSLPALVGTRALAAVNNPITTGKSVNFLYQFGGPSKFETFYPKVSAPEGVRSVNGEAATTLPGVTFGSLFPQLAKRAKQLAVVRACNAGGHVSYDVHPIVSKETLAVSPDTFHSRVVGMINSVDGVPTNAALFPQCIDARCPSVHMDFGNFLATGPVGLAFSPVVPDAGSTLQQNVRLNVVAFGESWSEGAKFHGSRPGRHWTGITFESPRAGVKVPIRPLACLRGNGDSYFGESK